MWEPTQIHQSQLLQPPAVLEVGLWQPLLASRDRSGHWELPSLSHGDDMVVEGVVVWKMPQPSLALEAVIASVPSVGGGTHAHGCNICFASLRLTRSCVRRWRCWSGNRR